MHPVMARTIYRIQERLLGRRSFACLRELERTQRLDRDALQAIQLRRLKELVHIGYEHTPYWREVMDHQGFGPDDIRTLDDLERFPLLVKSTLRERREEMVYRDEGPRLQQVRTSGSTNEALHFYTNANREAEINAARMRGHRWVGIEKGDKEVYFWASPVELSKQDKIKHLRDRLINDLLTNAIEMTPELVPEYVNTWKTWRAKCLFGYPSSFVLMAQWAPKTNTDLTVLKRSGTRCIVTTSEMLGEVNRRIIEEAFGLPVYDSYGLREVGLIGHECRHKTMHCNDEHMIFETIDPDTLEPTDGHGELVVTSLISRVMPIIRYRTGDVVTRDEVSDCPCGLKLSAVDVSGGRMVDFVVTDNGTWVAGYSFIYIARAVPGIVKFQVVQERRGELTIRLSTDEAFPPDGVEKVIRAAHDRLKSGDRVEVELVEDIEPAPSGKYRPVISKVAQDLRNQDKPS